VAHFGFRLVDPDDIDRAIAEVERAGGRLHRRGEFAPGLPYAYVADPDGYEIEIWFRTRSSDTRGRMVNLWQP
jgi:predicted enzyme related to lactoylglutathione lyase